MKNISFPNNFYFGAATAAVQIEGAWNEDGKSESNWDRWCHTPGKIKGGGTANIAVDHYHRWQEDVALMQQINLNSYRFSISWSRVIPTGIGALNPKGVAFYDRLIDSLLAAGIEPFVTLCHYDIPQALEDRGGWLNRDLTDWFAIYAGQMTRLFGDRVSHWMTINEPICISDDHYGGTVEPPGLGDLYARSVVTHHLLLGHGKALAAIKAAGGDHHQVGLVCCHFPAHPYRGSIDQLDVANLVERTGFDTPTKSGDQPVKEEDFDQAVRLCDDHITRRWLDPIFLGRYPDHLWENLGHAPDIRAGDMEIIGRRPDFHGINYYSRLFVRPVYQAGRLAYTTVTPAELGLPYTTMGWEIYPQGLKETFQAIRSEYNNPDVYVTENGLAYDDQISSDGRIHDQYRSDYIQQHLSEVQHAIQAGHPVKGYFAWTLMDNFEWEAGWGQRFGLIHVDYNTTLTRTIKDSGYWYRDFIRSHI